MSRILDVYFHGVIAGKLMQDRSGILSFNYVKEYVDNLNSNSISVSMPLGYNPYEGNVPKAFFSGLLPDDIVRNRLARHLGLSEKNSFALLEAVGGECAGALAFYQEGDKPPELKNEDVEELDEQQLKEILDLLKRRPLMAGGDNIRLSLAGAQDKIAVGLINNNIALVSGSTPTTHILKPLIEGINDSVHNEIFCMRLAKLMKINVPNVEIRCSKNSPYFLIERYDRVRDQNGNIKRLHQEDFCQALGVSPELKYQREGGPDVQQCLNLLQNYTYQPATDRIAFIRRLIFNYLVGNSDAHGKNYSLLYKNNIPSLSPAYDLFCTAVYPELSSKMAMKIGGEYEPEMIFLRHWYQIVPDSRSAKNTLEKDLNRMAADCLENAHILRESLNNEGIKSSIFASICKVIKKRASQISLELKV